MANWIKKIGNFILQLIFWALAFFGILMIIEKEFILGTLFCLPLFFFYFLKLKHKRAFNKSTSFQEKSTVNIPQSKSVENKELSEKTNYQEQKKRKFTVKNKKLSIALIVIILSFCGYEVISQYPNRALYAQGVEKAEKGDWNGAMELWSQIPDSSPYSKKIKSEEEIPVEKPSGEKVHLVNYTYAKDPTWEELLAFLKEDNTDDNPYKEGSFECTNFAEMLHNNAEKVGIKAAYVTIHFPKPPGHALNAFNTVDKGLVYVDDTGPGFTDLRDEFLSNKCEYDRISYLVEGEEEGTISIDYGSIDPTSYQFYEDYSKLWQDAEAKLADYKQKVEEYNAKVRVFNSKEQKYEAMVNEYSAKIDSVTKEIDQKYARELENFNKKIEDWKSRWDEHERKGKELNQKLNNCKNKPYVETINCINGLSSEITEFDAEENALISEQKALLQESNDINNRMNKEVSEKKAEFNSQKNELENQERTINNLKKDLDSMKKQLTSQASILEATEKNLNTCYWKSMGEVLKIETYW